MTHEIWEDKDRTKLRDNRKVFKLFREGLEPLIQEGRLGCVLLQFPYFFLSNRDNFDYLQRCRDSLAGVDAVVEFRNRSWVKERTFE